MTSDLSNGIAGQPKEHIVGAGVDELGLGPQHEHGQALEGGGQQVAAADQKHLGVTALETDEAGLHAAFGRAKGGQVRLTETQQGEILGQLAVQKFGGVFALDPNHPQMWQRRNAFKLLVHGVNYHRPIEHMGVVGL